MLSEPVGDIGELAAEGAPGSGLSASKANSALIWRCWFGWTSIDLTRWALLRVSVVVGSRFGGSGLTLATLPSVLLL